jgi:hypothetical protein
VVGAGTAAGSCEVVVVVLCVAGGACVVVVVVDSVVLCAITGTDRANTTSAPRATANTFFNFIRFSLSYSAKLNGRIPSTAGSEHNSSISRIVENGEPPAVRSQFAWVSASAMTDCAILRIDKESDGRRAIHREHSFSDLFVAHLLALNIRYEADLVDQLFNSSQKRLARILLLLAHFCKDDKT